MTTGLHCVRKCGKFVHVGISLSGVISANWNLISAMKELTVIGSSLGNGCWPRAFKLLEVRALSGATRVHRFMSL